MTTKIPFVISDPTTKEQQPGEIRIGEHGIELAFDGLAVPPIFVAFYQASVENEPKLRLVLSKNMNDDVDITSLEYLRVVPTYLVGLAQERAGNGEWPAPSSLSDYLFWIEDELEIQEDQHARYPEEDRLSFITYLRKTAEAIRELDVTPSPAPWNKDTVNVQS